MIKVRNNQFYIKGRETCYIFGIYQNRFPVHLYWGSVINGNTDLLSRIKDNSVGRAFHVALEADGAPFIDDLKYEFNVFSGGDYRVPTYHAKYSDGTTVSEFEYIGYEIKNGKPALKGLPHVYAQSDNEAQTLEVTFKDSVSGMCAILSYTMFEEYDVLTRSIRYINEGGEEIHLLSAQSACVDFDGLNYKLMHLHGDWLHERSIEFTDIKHGKFEIDSKRGMSSHAHNPFIALMDKNADEYNGEVFGFSLVYSGNFSASAEGTSNGNTRVSMGLNQFNFDWTLEKGEEFQTPEVVMVYSPSGINAMSQKYHKIYRERLVRGKYRDAIRPVVINTWEGVGLDVEEKRLIEIAKKAAEIGCELYVLDDGWQGDYENAVEANGDWFTNTKRLPNGMDGLANAVNKLGMKFGLWFEPEMVAPQSHLYQAHPEWCLRCKGRKMTETKEEFVLDYSIPEVREHIFNTFKNMLTNANIEYIKWDCNRNITETQDMMHHHKFVLGLYEVLERLNQEFPHVLIEGCSGGGGRFDPGMLYYTAQTWTSDNTRIRGRYDIQYGTSVVYPASSMCCHVAKINENAQEYDKQINSSALLAMCGNFGFELDLSKISDFVKEEFIRYTKLYKEIRKTVLFGDMYRLESPFDTKCVSWEFSDGEEVLLFCFQMFNMVNGEKRIIKLKGLEKDAVYVKDGVSYYGDELMNCGIAVPTDVYEYNAVLMRFKKER